MEIIELLEYAYCSNILKGLIMRLKEKLEARRLRCLGYSFNEIHKKLGVAKSSVSLWVRDIRLTPEQKLELSQKG
ncbi:MAG: hypothetical protein ABIJ19_02610, partial [Patescibacteria group bacterium]